MCQDGMTCGSPLAQELQGPSLLLTSYGTSATRWWKTQVSGLRLFFNDNACLTTGQYIILTTAQHVFKICTSANITSMCRNGKSSGLPLFPSQQSRTHDKDGLTGLQKGLQVARVPSLELAAVAMVPCPNENMCLLRQWCQKREPLPCSEVNQGQSDM